MHSMLRQNQIRFQDVKPYVRSFNRNDPRGYSDWAKEEGTLFDPGILIFLLEPAKRPPGMSSFAQKQEGAGAGPQDSFRVKDLCVVVDRIDAKSWVLAIGPSAFELRFLDALFREKAQKSILDGIDFNYLAARPRQSLDANKLKELRELSSMYSKSGSRRTMAEGGGPEEPAKAMLQFLGADLSPLAAKGVLELGSICNMVFAPEGQQENKLQNLIKTVFIPILSTDKLKATDGQAASAEPDYVAEQPEYAQSQPDSSAPDFDTPVSQMTAPAAAPAAPNEPSAWINTPASNPASAPGSSFQSDLNNLSDDFSAIDEQFAPLDETPELISSFKSLQQPPIEMSPDMPAILTGEHPIITPDQLLSSGSEDNGQSAAPTLPAWYMTTHDLEEMNKVALRLAQTASRLPEGLDKLEAELSYDALPAVDRFAKEEPPTAWQESPAAMAGTPQASAAAPQAVVPPQPAVKEDFAAQFRTDYEQGEAGEAAFPHAEESGRWAQPAVDQVSIEPATFDEPAPEPAMEATPVEEVPPALHSVFQDTGARGSLEYNPEAALPQQVPATPTSQEWKAKDSTTGGVPQPPKSDWDAAAAAAAEAPAEKTNLFDRLGGTTAEPEEEGSAHSWARPGGGRPTNLKDMLTADSAVFTTDKKPQEQLPSDFNNDVAPAAEAAVEPAAAEPAAAQVMPAEEVAAADAVALAPDAVAAEPVAQIEEAPAADITDGAEAPAPWTSLSRPSQEMTLPAVEEAPAAEPTATAAPEAQEDYKQLAEALHGLIDSPDAIQAPPEPAETAPAAAGRKDRSLFDDMDDEDEEENPLAQTSEVIVDMIPPAISLHAGAHDTEDEDQSAAAVAAPAEAATAPAEAVSSADIATPAAPPAVPEQTGGFWAEERPARQRRRSTEMTQDLSEVIPEELILKHAQDLGAEPAAQMTKAEAEAAALSAAEEGEPAAEELPDSSAADSAVRSRRTAAAPTADIQQPPVSTRPGRRSFRPFNPSSEQDIPAAAQAAAAQQAQTEAAEAAQPAAGVTAEFVPPASPVDQSAGWQSAAATAMAAAQAALQAAAAADALAVESAAQSAVEATAQEAAADAAALASAAHASADAAAAVAAAAQATADSAAGITSSTSVPAVAAGTTSSTSVPAVPVGTTSSTSVPAVPVGTTSSTSVPAVPVGTSSSTSVPAVPVGTTSSTSVPAVPTGTTSSTSVPAIPTATTSSTSVPALPAAAWAAEPAKPAAPLFTDSETMVPAVQTPAAPARPAQPAVEPKLVLSETTRFMARLNQRLSEAEKKLSSRCEQSRDRLMRELDALVEEAQKIERQNDLTTSGLTSQLITHLESVSEDVKGHVGKAASESLIDVEKLLTTAQQSISTLHQDMTGDLIATAKGFQTELDELSEETTSNLDKHMTKRVTEFQKRLNEVLESLESVYQHHESALLARFDRFKARLTEEVDAIGSALDRNVNSMTAEIDGSWERASEKLTVSKIDFGSSVEYLVQNSRAEIKQVHIDAYSGKVLPRLLENKDIFRSMLTDMKRNFEEETESVMAAQVIELTGIITQTTEDMNKLIQECMLNVETVGKGQQAGLEELYKSTSTRLEELTRTVETRLKAAREEIVDNDEACTRLSEASRIEDEPAFGREKQHAVAALNDCRSRADNTLETVISSSCLQLEQLSEELQEDLAKRRTDWTAMVRGASEEGISKIKAAIQDALQTIESTKDKYME